MWGKEEGGQESVGKRGGGDKESVEEVLTSAVRACHHIVRVVRQRVHAD